MFISLQFDDDKANKFMYWGVYAVAFRKSASKGQ
jgi:hypothetical protein